MRLGIQGHRGARGLFPENTLEGFRAAAALGVAAFELDVGMTADGVVVVHHDPALNPDIARDAGGKWVDDAGLLIHSMTFETLRSFDVGRLRPRSRTDTLFPDQTPINGARIPTLAAVLDALPHAKLTVEIKTHPPQPGATAPPSDLAAATLAIIDAADAADRVVIESFDWRVQRHIRRCRPDIRLAWLTRPETTSRLWWDIDPLPSVPASVAREGGPIWAPSHGTLTEADVHAAHNLGLLVLPWTVNLVADMQRLAKWGVDGLISDRPDLAIEANLGWASRADRLTVVTPHAALPPTIGEKRTMAITVNNTKRRLQAGKMALGFGVHHLRTVATPMLIAASGHDWMFIDAEHGAFNIQEITQLCIAALPVGVTPIVRVCAGAIDEATRALDNGALGIVVPHVDTPAEAKRIADAFHYPPMGRRSWGGPPALYGFQAPSNAEAQAAINQEILTVVMLESPEAIHNADAIAAVEGVDVLFIGTSDLTAELGISGQMGHPKVIEAYQSVGDACKKHGKTLGMGGVYDEQHASRYVGMGARFLLSGSDHLYILTGARQRIDFFRGLPGAPPG